MATRPTQIAAHPVAGRQWPHPHAEHSEEKWYAAYTSAQHEKQVAEQLGARSVAYYLPLYESVRRWKDRRVTLQMPLFPGYVFVRIALGDRLRVLQVPGVARLVGFGGLATALPEEEIEVLRTRLTSEVQAQPHPYLTTGRRVRIKEGSLAGLEGILLRLKRNWRIILSLDVIQRSISVEVDASSVEATMK